MEDDFYDDYLSIFEEIYREDGSKKRVISLLRRKDESEEDWYLRTIIAEIINMNYPDLSIRSIESLSSDTVECITMRKECTSKEKEMINKVLPRVDEELATLDLEKWLKKMDKRNIFLKFDSDIRKWISDQNILTIPLVEYIKVRDKYGSLNFNNIIQLLKDKKVIKSIILGR